MTTTPPSACWAITWWTLRGFTYGARHGTVYNRVLSTAMVLGWLLTCWALPPAYWLLLRCPARTWYGSAADGAVWAATTRASRSGTTWTFSDHFSARPGTGQGGELRRRVLPTLLSAADTSDATIVRLPATPALAAVYLAETPGLVDVGRNRPRGRRLERAPQPPAPSAVAPSAVAPPPPAPMPEPS